VAEGRDTDEAPLDEDNSEEEQSATMGEPYPTVEEHHENGHDPDSSDRIFPTSQTGTDSVVDHLRVLADAIEALEHELVETHQRAEAQADELAELRRAHASDLETIDSLGAELEQRRDRLDALRAVVGDLAVELDK
jgi:Mg2+ and Co2+ transporter CorA